MNTVIKSIFALGIIANSFYLSGCNNGSASSITDGKRGDLSRLQKKLAAIEQQIREKSAEATRRALTDTDAPTPLHFKNMQELDRLHKELKSLRQNRQSIVNQLKSMGGKPLVAPPKCSTCEGKKMMYRYNRVAVPGPHGITWQTKFGLWPCHACDATGVKNQ